MPSRVCPPFRSSQSISGFPRESQTPLFAHRVRRQCRRVARSRESVRKDRGQSLRRSPDGMSDAKGFEASIVTRCSCEQIPWPGDAHQSTRA